MANKNTNPGGGKPQFLQTSTMPNPHISPNLTTLGRGNVPVARNSNPKPQKRQNQAIRKNSTIPQSNFHSSWGLSPEVLHPQPIGLQTDSLKSHRRQRRIPTSIRPPAEFNPTGTAQIVS